LPADLFRVALTRDFLDRAGRVGFGDIGLAALDAADGLAYEFLEDDHSELPAGSLAGFGAAIVLAPRVSRTSLQGADDLLVVARFGVGYDNVDVGACSEAGVVVTITPDGVRRPVALSALTLVLALAHRLPEKDRLVRTGRWSAKLDYMGEGLAGRTLGLVGWGNVGQELTRLAQPFGVRQVAFDPFADASAAARAGVELVDLDGLLSAADFVVLMCALTPETHHLIDAARLSRMKSGAYLVNVARGPVVDQRALTTALGSRAIAGAALDVFEQEPPAEDDPLLELDNVILSPHAICWTDELALGNGQSAIAAVLDVAAGRRPKYPVNPAAFGHPRFESHLNRAARRIDEVR